MQTNPKKRAALIAAASVLALLLILGLVLMLVRGGGGGGGGEGASVASEQEGSLPAGEGEAGTREPENQEEEGKGTPTPPPEEAEAEEFPALVFFDEQDSPAAGSGGTGSIGGGTGSGGAGGTFSGRPRELEGAGLGQRRGEGRARALGAGGGSSETERAVYLALDWLKRHQGPDGTWDSSPPTHRTGVTGLALLCFLGAGESESSKAYGDTVRRALEFLLDTQQEDGTYPGTRNYTLAICTMALAEAYVMDDRPEVGLAAERGVGKILKRQCPAGGWDYLEPGSRNDMSVSGWAIMALKSASVAGIPGLKAAYPKFQKLIDETIGGRPGGWYTPSGKNVSTGNAMHAVAMLCRLLMGARRPNALLEGARIQAERLPQWQSRHTYRLYYATLALFQIGGPSWRTWNDHVSKMLVENQRKDGDFSGSWDAGSGQGENAGPAYVTSLCCLTLEVYYRYAAIYR